MNKTPGTENSPLIDCMARAFEWPKDLDGVHQELLVEDAIKQLKQEGRESSERIRLVDERIKAAQVQYFLAARQHNQDLYSWNLWFHPR